MMYAKCDKCGKIQTAGHSGDGNFSLPAEWLVWRGEAGVSFQLCSYECREKFNTSYQIALNKWLEEQTTNDSTHAQ